MKILLVDDDRGDRAQLIREFGKTGLHAELLQATSISEAISAIQESLPDCVMLDYQIPGIEELEGLESLRALDEFLPIILVTGFGDELLAARAINSGADEYIPKHELNRQTLEYAVNNAIEKASLRRELARQRNEVDSFAHMLSHDLRAPLNQIQTFSDMVIEALEEKNYEDLEVFVGFMRKSAVNASHLVKLLTDFLGTDKRELLMEPVELADILNEVAQTLVESDCKLTLKLDDLPSVISSSVLLRQIFQNLLSNACKYNRNEQAVVNVACKSDANCHLISLQDNGIGMEKSELENIFKPFVRLHGTSEFEGTGLGLAICEKNAKRLGGSLRVESTPGKGSCFYLSLPVVGAADSHTAPV